MTETVSSSIDIRASADEILEVLCDFERYPEWAEQMESASVVRADEQGRPLEVEFLVAPGPLPKVRYTLRYTYLPDGLGWEYVRGDLKDLRGSYTLRGGPEATTVVYDLAVDPGRIPLPGFVRARAAREITKIALSELKRRVELGGRAGVS